jgi:hypothetical protein
MVVFVCLFVFFFLGGGGGCGVNFFLHFCVMFVNHGLLDCH